MVEKHTKGRVECPFRACETVKKQSTDTKWEGFIRGQEETTDACPLCAANVKERIEKESRLSHTF